MSYTIIRPRDRAEWLKQRESGIGSSEVATIIGLNPWETPYQLWRRKVGLDAPKNETFAMKAGHYLEDAVAQFWHDETGQTIIKQSAGDWLIVNKERQYMRVSPDRTFWLGESRAHKDKGILECKTTQMAIDPDDIPKHWFTQLQYQLGVAELEHGSLAWLCSGREFGYKNCAFVPEYFELLVESVEKFWIDNIQGKKEPEAVNVQDILIKYNKHTDNKVIEVGTDEYNAYTELKEVREQLDAIEERKKALEDKLKMCFGDAEAISYEGQTLATWKAPKPSEKFDDKAFKAAHPEVAKEYTKLVAGARRFLLK